MDGGGTYFWMLGKSECKIYNLVFVAWRSTVKDGKTGSVTILID